MSRQLLRGLSGASPLGFIASLGLLRLCHQKITSARLGFVMDGSFPPFIEGFDNDLAALVAEDASATKHPSWWLEYDKADKTSKRVADPKAPPPEFRKYLARCVDAWCNGDDDAAAYRACCGTSTARDRPKRNTKPTAFHFTAANQQFLGT